MYLALPGFALRRVPVKTFKVHRKDAGRIDLDALKWAVRGRRPTYRLVDHSHRGLQYPANRATQRSANAGIVGRKRVDRGARWCGHGQGAPANVAAAD